MDSQLKTLKSPLRSHAGMKRRIGSIDPIEISEDEASGGTPGKPGTEEEQHPPKRQLTSKAGNHSHVDFPHVVYRPDYLQGFQDEISELRKKLDEKDVENVEYRNEVDKLQKENSKLKDKINELKERIYQYKNESIGLEMEDSKGTIEEKVDRLEVRVAFLESTRESSTVSDQLPFLEAECSLTTTREGLA